MAGSKVSAAAPLVDVTDRLAVVWVKAPTQAAAVAAAVVVLIGRAGRRLSGGSGVLGLVLARSGDPGKFIPFPLLLILLLLLQQHAPSSFQSVCLKCKITLLRLVRALALSIRYLSSS